MRPLMMAPSPVHSTVPPGSTETRHAVTAAAEIRTMASSVRRRTVPSKGCREMDGRGGAKPVPLLRIEETPQRARNAPRDTQNCQRVGTTNLREGLLAGRHETRGRKSPCYPNLSGSHRSPVVRMRWIRAGYGDVCGGVEAAKVLAARNLRNGIGLEHERPRGVEPEVDARVAALLEDAIEAVGDVLAPSRQSARSMHFCVRRVAGRSVRTSRFRLTSVRFDAGPPHVANVISHTGETLQPPIAENRAVELAPLDELLDTMASVAD